MKTMNMTGIIIMKQVYQTKTMREQIVSRKIHELEVQRDIMNTCSWNTIMKQPHLRAAMGW